MIRRARTPVLLSAVIKQVATLAVRLALSTLAAVLPEKLASMESVSRRRVLKLVSPAALTLTAVHLNAAMVAQAVESVRLNVVHGNLDESLSQAPSVAFLL